MATKVSIGSDGALFIGEDKVLRMHVKDSAAASVDITTWAISFSVSLRDNTAAVLSKSATITGTYAAVANPQRAEVTLTDTEMLTLDRRKYRHSWKRTDDGAETILSYGDFIVEEAVQK